MRWLELTVLASVCAFLSMTVAPAHGATNGWPKPGWQYRSLIIAEPDSIQGNDTFTDFALLVSLNGTDHSDVFDAARADGGDLLFTEGDGATELDREIVSYDNGSQTAEIWVNMPSLSKLDNELYLYYGNPDSVLSTSPTDAWSDDYRVVYHFEDDPGGGVLSDSSPQAAHAALAPERGWSSSDATSGQFGQGWFFDGISHHINSNAISSTDSSYAVSGWLLNVSGTQNFFTQANPGFWELASQVFNSPDYTVNGVGLGWGPQPIPLNDGYHHFLWAFDGVSDTLLFYYDGEPQDIISVWQPENGPIYTGRQLNPDNAYPVGIVGPMYFQPFVLMHGGADEFRIRDGVVTPDRVRTEYLSQSEPSTFLNFGPEEPASEPPVGIGDEDTILQLRIFPNPTRSTSAVHYSLSKPGPARVAVYDIAGRLVRVLVDREHSAGQFRSMWDGKNRGGRRVARGVYFLRLQTPESTRSTKLMLLR